MSITNDLIIAAIRKINPVAQVTVSGHSLNDIEWLSETTPIAVSDIEAQIPIVEAEEAAAITNTAAKKASGKAKLKSGEALTDAEISALFGDN